MSITNEKTLDLLSYGCETHEILSVDHLKKLTPPPRTNHNVCGADYVCNCWAYTLEFEPEVYVCTDCGLTTYGFVNEWIDKIWTRNRSVHSRRNWFKRKVQLHIDFKYVNMLVHDFMEVVRTMDDKGLITGRNVSRYTYYIIRLRSRRDVPTLPNKTIKDMVDSETRRLFDDRLFGKVYPALKWDIGCTCPYYLRWNTRTIGDTKVAKSRKSIKSSKSSKVES